MKAAASGALSGIMTKNVTLIGAGAIAATVVEHLAGGAAGARVAALVVHPGREERAAAMAPEDGFPSPPDALPVACDAQASLRIARLSG